MKQSELICKKDWISIDEIFPPFKKVIEVKGEISRRAKYDPETASFTDCDNYPSIFTVKEWRNV